MGQVLSVNHIVTEAMYKYDHNKSGVIDLKRPDGIVNRFKNPDERIRSNTTVNSYSDDKLTVSTSVYTMRDLFYAADADRDGKVTRDELMAEVKKFDKDGNGEMTSRGFWGWLTRKPKQELDLFKKEFGEKTQSYGSIDL